MVRVYGEGILGYCCWRVVVVIDWCGWNCHDIRTRVTWYHRYIRRLCRRIVE